MNSSTRKTKRTTVKAYEVKDLKEWVARWPSDGTLGFNPVTREPVVYNQDSGPAETRIIQTTIPWKRRADILDVLSHPSQYSAQAVQVAQSKYARTRPRPIDAVEFQDAEAKLLEAWRAFTAASGSGSGSGSSLRAEIHEAQAELTALEEANAEIIQPKRELQSVSHGCGNLTEMQTMFVQPIPIKKRGIDMGEIAETEA